MITETPPVAKPGGAQAASGVIAGATRRRDRSSPTDPESPAGAQAATHLVGVMMTRR